MFPLKVNSMDRRIIHCVPPVVGSHFSQIPCLALNWDCTAFPTNNSHDIIILYSAYLSLFLYTCKGKGKSIKIDYFHLFRAWRILDKIWMEQMTMSLLGELHKSGNCDEEEKSMDHKWG
jgi:hypothetical protein